MMPISRNVVPGLCTGLDWRIPHLLLTLIISPNESCADLFFFSLKASFVYLSERILSMTYFHHLSSPIYYVFILMYLKYFDVIKNIQRTKE